MPERRRSSSTTRAEARRRARLAARGYTSDEEDEVETAPADARPSLLRQIFAPPVAPLPGMPEPLAGFDYRGPARPLMAGLWLLARNPLAWLVPAVIAALLHRVILPATGDPTGLISSAILYGVLFGAGWFGWQRPWLFGAVASVLGYGLLMGYGVVLAATEGALGTLSTEQWTMLAVQGIFWAVVGAVAGWFGGYYRRRRADPQYRKPRSRTR
jgi:hypothetical protein